jgi:hypothetical protein
MSLHKFAEQVASQGRGDDSLLVHMTPDEVQRLQAFAEANGRSLTINPTTGLPEAGFLSDLFKAVAPIALGAFLGPAGMGISFGGLSSALSAGIATGGITTLATGSLSRGLMAGLGAYGGAGLGESLMGAGTGAGMTEALAGSSTGNLGQAFGDVAATATDGSAGSAFNKFLTSNANPATMSASELASSGFKAAASDPLGFAKGNLGNLAYAAAPIMAGAMVPTTTKLPDPKDRFIRMMDYNINPDTGKPDPLYGMREMTPIKTSDFKGKTFQGQRDLFRQQNPNPYELGVGSLNQPPQQQQQTTPMASGGIVALAGGGDIPGYAAGGYKPTDTEIFNYFKTPGLTDAQIAADMQKFTVSAADIARATGTQNQQADYEKRFVNTLVSPTTDASDFQKATSAVGLQDQALATAMQNAGLSQGAQYALTQPAMSDAGFTGGIIDAGTGKPVELYNQIGYTAGALPGDQGGLEGLYGNINYTATGLQNLIDTGKMSVADAQNAALAELARTGVSVADVKAATGTDFGNLFKPKTVTPITPLPQPFTPIVPGGIKLPGATVYDNGAFGNYGSGPATGVDYNGNTVSIATPGDIITNPDGTRTVVPNVPGRPYGGFTGMEGVKSAYTAGGGSLGYTSPVVKTAAEHNAKYNKLTDDSLDAYNFLMGKGKNLTQRTATADRPVMRRYDEAVLGRKIARPTRTTTDKVTTVVGTPGNPQSYFDEAAYLAANPSVATELKTGKSVSGEPTRFTSGYEHYLMYGKAEGRPFTGDYEGYTTAAALANAARESGGDGPTGPSGGGNPNSISGFTPAPPDNSIPDTSMSPSTASPPGDVGESVSGVYNSGGMIGYAMGGGLGSLGSYSDGGRLLKGPGDGVSDSIPATIGRKQQPARLADGEFVIPARIVSELGNGSTDAGAKKLYAMMDRVQRARGKTTGKNKVAANSRSDKYLPA